MPTKTYARGLLLWIDDNLENLDLPSDAWSEIFGGHSDRVFRLFDLSLEVATSYEEAISRIRSFDSYREAGTFILCVVDLLIPARYGMEPAMKYGVALAKELRKRGVTFVFLSSNTGATSTLDQERLSTVPYHVKEPGSVWRFPNSLALNALSELRRRISWISVEDIVEAMHEDSDIRSTYGLMPDSFRYFPYFGPYREFVERCEYRGSTELAPVIAVRSPRQHCDEFVQQALSIMLYQTLLRKPGATRVSYGHAHDQAYLQRLDRSDVREDADSIAVIRVTPNFTTIDELKRIIESTRLRSGKMVFVLPNDESVDQYVELLRGLYITVKEELPQTRLGDVAQREELIRHSCTLAFHLWTGEQALGEPVRLEMGSLTHPELLINPIHWTALLETMSIPAALSDSFEIVKELNEVLNSMGIRQRLAIQHALEQGQPVPYELLLQVGHKALVTSEYKDKVEDWIERTLDTWLRVSWQYPYGIWEGLYQGGLSDTGYQTVAVEREEWQDSCYEILVGILAEYEKYAQKGKMLTTQQLSLRRVARFIGALGGIKLLSAETDSVDWDELTLMRWPHRQYPMPSAIVRRLREAGRYLWIQPEGLDIAVALPTGRQRYRLLGSIVDQYWSVLTWTRTIAKDLPLGWKGSVGYLSEVISENRIGAAWQEEPEEVWCAFLTLLRNGGPIVFIADRILHGKPLAQGKDSAKNFLGSVGGYGTILNRLRGSRERRIGQCLVPDLSLPALSSDLRRLQQIGHYLDIFADRLGDDGKARVQEIEVAALALIKAIGEALNTSKDEDSTAAIPAVNAALTSFFGDPEIKMTKGDGWYLDSLKDVTYEFFSRGDIPSLFSTKADYLWQALDALLCLENVTRYYRYYDGYHFLAALNELRVNYKDNMAPNVPLSVIERIMDLFVVSIEGLLAQLSWCVKVAGKKELADRFRPPGVRIQVPEDIVLPSSEELASVLRVNVTGEEWEVYTLGIPGKSTVSKLCYQDGVSVTEWEQ